MSTATGLQRVLWLTVEVPDARMGGASIREYHLLNAVLERAEVDLVTRGRLRDDLLRSRLGRVVELAQPGPPVRSGWRRRLRDLRWAADPAPVEVIENRALARGAATSVNPDAYTHVVVAHAGLAQLLPSTRTNRWVLNLCQLGSRRAAHAAVVARTRRERALLERERRKAERFERGCGGAYDLFCVVSEADRASCGAGAVVPNGVDTRGADPTPVPASAGLVMTGSLNTAANVDAAKWFCHEVLPLIRRSVPAASVELVGKQPTPEVLALGELDHVVVRADVPDVAPFLASARAAVVPVRIGSGSRLKALEAMNAGRPVIGTSVGLEGIGAVDRENVLLGETAEAMASAAVEVLTDHALAERLARAGRQHVVQAYDWTLIGAGFADLVLGR